MIKSSCLHSLNIIFKTLGLNFSLPMDSLALKVYFNGVW